MDSELADSKQIGAGLALFGVIFIGLGLVLFFDAALLTIGNLLLIVGLTLVVGIQSTLKFIFQRRKVKGTGLFLGGILVMLLGWVFVGILIEIWGFILLFRGFIPYAVNYLRQKPMIGLILSLPGIREASFFEEQIQSGLDFMPAKTGFLPRCTVCNLF